MRLAVVPLRPFRMDRITVDTSSGIQENPLRDPSLVTVITAGVPVRVQGLVDPTIIRAVITPRIQVLLYLLHLILLRWKLAARLQVQLVSAPLS